MSILDKLTAFIHKVQEYHFTLEMEVVSSSKTLVNAINATLHGETAQMTVIYLISTTRA
jgi:hypothetical protein